MAQRSLDDVAQDFDEIYTRMTQLQKRLIAATRAGKDGPAVRELADEAAAMIAAFRSGARAVDLRRMSPLEMEAEALRARVLALPIDGHLLLAAARSQGRAHAYPLLADAIAMADGEAFWESLSVEEVLGAPTHIGAARARWLIRTLELDGKTPVAELDSTEQARLIEGLREFADHLPAEATGRAHRPKFPDDGAGAGPDILRRWVDPLGTPTDELYEVAWAKAQQPGWPDDAVGVLEILVGFTHNKVLPLIVPGFQRILEAELDHHELVAALRAELRSWRDRWHAETDEDRQYEASARWWAIERDVLALQALHKARALIGTPREDWTGKPPLTLAREGARRCGEALSLLESPEGLLEELPGAAPAATA